MSTDTKKRLPRVAIVGRPNVGKSTLANRMCGSRVSIVEPSAGVTRDRVAIPARLDTALGPRWIEDVDGFERPAEAPVMKLAVVGQRNAGKSTLINALAREERMIVSEVPGTTRDAVDVVFERDGKTFVAIDTAGIRKKKSHADAIDFYSDARSHKSIRRADVVILLFDVTQKLSAVDKTLARYVVDHHKPVILGANKWDLVLD